MPEKKIDFFFVQKVENFKFRLQVYQPITMRENTSVRNV